MENLCIFYASKYHLSMILLEYFKNKDIKKYTVNTFLKNGLENEISNLVDKYKINNYFFNSENLKGTKDILQKQIESKSNSIFVIEGDMDYIKKANKYVRTNAEKNDLKNIKIINCFDFAKNCDYITEIVKSSDRILYTNGSKVID